MTIPDPVFDAQEILRVLARHGVDFVVIGGIAVQAHGYIRFTKDLDVILRPTALNFSRLSEALPELEAELRSSGALKLTDPHQLRRAPRIPLITTAGPLDARVAEFRSWRFHSPRVGQLSSTCSSLKETESIT